jgi:hypothetical protein
MGRYLPSAACCVIFLGVVCRHGRGNTAEFWARIAHVFTIRSLSAGVPMPARRLKRGPNRDSAAPRAPNSKRRATRMRSATTRRMTIRMGAHPTKRGPLRQPLRRHSSSLAALLGLRASQQAPLSVMPAHAGIQGDRAKAAETLDPRIRGDDSQRRRPKSSDEAAAARARPTTSASLGFPFLSRPLILIGSALWSKTVTRRRLARCCAFRRRREPDPGARPKPARPGAEEGPRRSGTEKLRHTTPRICLLA